MKPRAFVVMPFGVKEVPAPSTAKKLSKSSKPKAIKPLYVDFDALYEMLIKPALNNAGCEPFRADEDVTAESILTGMFFELLTADIVVADQSIWNPNVFYECGLRDAARRGGFISIHGDWTKSAFDLALQRRFKYRGELWLKGAARDEVWQATCKKEIASLTKTFKAAIDASKAADGSQFYKELTGLDELDWSKLQSAKAKYFVALAEDWKDRIAAAESGGFPGDILTLAEDAPTRYFWERITLRAAKALVGMHRFEAARDLLKSITEQTTLIDAQTQLGLVYARLGATGEARVLLQRLEKEHQNDPEVSGILAGVYKEIWRGYFDKLEPLANVQAAAAATSANATAAVNSYSRAYWTHLDSYYLGINVLTLVRLLEHLRGAGLQLAIPQVPDIDHLPTVLRVAIGVALRKADAVVGGQASSDKTWALASLGELELLEGSDEKAVRLYQEAANGPDVTCFMIDSMRRQVQLMVRLGFKQIGAEGVLHALNLAMENRRKPSREYKRVFICSGHMTDRKGRKPARFPHEKVERVAEEIDKALTAWNIGDKDLAICGGARGADILFAEASVWRNAHVRLLVALPEEKFFNESVRHPQGGWISRYHALKKNELCEVRIQQEALGPPREADRVWDRNNRWIINTARAEAPPDPIYALLVWDEKTTGDGEGGTADFARLYDEVGGGNDPVIINPTLL